MFNLFNISEKFGDEINSDGLDGLSPDVIKCKLGILVSEYKSTKIDSLKKVKKQIENVNGKISGVILNKTEVFDKKYGNGYYSDKSERKQIEETNQEIKTVEELFNEINENIIDADDIKVDNSISLLDEETININSKKKKSDSEMIKDVKKEILIIKKLFIQYVMVNQKKKNKITDGTIENNEIGDLKKEIEGLKKVIKSREKSDKLFEEDIKDELIRLRKSQDELKQIHSENNNKIDELIDNYKKKLKS